jgi:hypothetical protein
MKLEITPSTACLNNSLKLKLQLKIAAHCPCVR